MNYRYSEDQTIAQLKAIVDSTYSEHYSTDSSGDAIQCMDAWIALGSAVTSSRDTAMKYLWRLGKKGDYAAARKDAFKAMHFILFALHAMELSQNKGVK
jgi:hypothetical protein